ncbi:ABC transporter ATP-binding protein [Anaerostipes sp.]|uniref:ABC transporter ATP-binding protein n=1 Tax=Anaerostipes sp. TaxID=1872530 RepID=UPI0025C656CC|nr:ATP-binding cassette domain-containing protein [Anaerostipes sp.]MBS7009381.1 ATP-binding cassette domain-containing protein [Anaerostipes sp.]
MSDYLINVNHLTKDYGHGRGIFDINLDVGRGEVFGFVGTNGAGKTTTIRHIMGFIKPDSGNAFIHGCDSWKHSSDLMKHVSYVPGEIAFPSLPTGTDFLKLQAEYLHVTDFAYMNHLIKLLQLDPTADLKRMSKGMKQKTAIVAALMGNKDILILDEPTTGLDPLMRESFLELIREEKAKGHTIFMSSHIFEEIEEVCDRVAMIKGGKIIDTLGLYQLRHWDTKTFHIAFEKRSEYSEFVSRREEVEDRDDEKMYCTVVLPKKEVNELFKQLNQYSVASLHEEHLSLEQYFRNIYEKECR